MGCSHTRGCIIVRHPAHLIWWLDLLHFVLPGGIRTSLFPLVLRSRVACLWIGHRLALAARCG